MTTAIRVGTLVVDDRDCAFPQPGELLVTTAARVGTFFVDNHHRAFRDRESCS